MIKETNYPLPQVEIQLPGRKPHNKTAEYDLTILVPLFNEEDNMYPLEQNLSAFLSQSLLRACVLFVNDGSMDQSKLRMLEICRRQKHFYHLSLAKNSGLSAALKAGIEHTWSDLVGYMDADLQTSPQDFNQLIPYAKDYAMVLGIRTVREDSFVKRSSSRIANRFRRFMTKDGIEDTGCPLKIMKTDYAKRIPLFNGMHRFLPALIQLQNGEVKQIPVRHFPRVAGKSKYHLGNRLIAPFLDCFAFRWMKRRYINVQVTDTNLE